MRPLLVLGLGNRLMMDDGVGVAVVEALARQQPPGERVRYEVVETDFAYGLELAAQAERLVLVDAVEFGGRPGEVATLPLREIDPAGPGLSLHHAHLVDLLLCREPETAAVLVGIEPFQIGFHLGLSTEMEQRFEQIVAQVKGEIERLLPC